MSWDEDDRFDDKTYAENVRRAITANVHGVYTTGSSGEFYALAFDEFSRMVDIQAELCGNAGMPLQVGCCSDSTAETIQLLEYAAGTKAVGAVQICIPYWMELTDRELHQFFKDLYTACPDVPLVHYNIPRAKRFLIGQDYLRVLEVAPSLIGVKFTFAGTYYAALQESIMMTPDVSYFVGETLLASGMQIGARGSYSALVLTNPRFMLEMYAKAEAGEWDIAISMQQRCAQFYAELEAFLEKRNEGAIDPVVDKGLAVAAGCVLGHQRCRAPYIGWSDETILAVREWLEQSHPEFVYPG
jgi:dihydrodipicolinate synthase/N-acetylneuraminate lyase